jgi:hypothetical protein
MGPDEAWPLTGRSSQRRFPGWFTTDDLDGMPHAPARDTTRTPSAEGLHPVISRYSLAVLAPASLDGAGVTYRPRWTST